MSDFKTSAPKRSSSKGILAKTGQFLRNYVQHNFLESTYKRQANLIVQKLLLKNEIHLLDLTAVSSRGVEIFKSLIPQGHAFAAQGLVPAERDFGQPEIDRVRWVKGDFLKYQVAEENQDLWQYLQAQNFVPDVISMKLIVPHLTEDFVLAIKQYREKFPKAYFLIMLHVNPRVQLKGYGWILTIGAKQMAYLLNKRYFKSNLTPQREVELFIETLNPLDTHKSNCGTQVGVVLGPKVTEEV